MSQSNKFAYIANVKRTQDACGEKIKTVKEWTGMQNKQCKGLYLFNSSDFPEV